LDEIKGSTSKLDADESQTELVMALAAMKKAEGGGLGSGNRRRLLELSSQLRRADAVAERCARQTADAGSWRALRCEVEEALASADDEASAVATLLSWVQSALATLPSAKQFHLPPSPLSVAQGAEGTTTVAANAANANANAEDSSSSSSSSSTTTAADVTAAAAATAKKISKAVAVTGAVGLTKGGAVAACAKLAEALAAVGRGESSSLDSPTAETLDEAVVSSGFLEQLQEQEGGGGGAGSSGGSSGGSKSAAEPAGGSRRGSGGGGSSGVPKAALGPMQKAMQASWQDEQGNALGISM
jgi:hypothetical protein